MNPKIQNFLAEAHMKALLHSKDASTKVGCFILDEDFTTLTQGYNGIPRKVKETEERQQRPLKYDFFEHAERNAIYNLARPRLKGSTCVTTIVPSMNCIRALVSVGIKKLCMPTFSDTKHANIAMQMLTESGVEIYTYDQQGRLDIQDNREQRKLETFIQEGFLKLKSPKIKDPTPNVTLFLDDDFTIVTEGYSGFPRGSDDNQVQKYTGPERELWVETSIRNGIYNLVRPLLKNCTGVVTATTCIDCARAFAGVGLSSVVYMEPSDDFKSRWKDSIYEGVEMLKKLGINTQEVPRHTIFHKIEQAMTQQQMEKARDLLSSSSHPQPL